MMDKAVFTGPSKQVPYPGAGRVPSRPGPPQFTWVADGDRGVV
jgi:hypothetical protein